MTIRIPATAFWCDAVKRSADPTGTLDIRKRFGSLCEQRFRKVRGVLQQSIVDRDVLGLNPASTSPLAMAGSPGNKEIAFQTWLDNLLRRMVVEDGAWMRPMIALAYVRAVARAQRLTHSSAVPHDRTETIDVLATLALTELQGICEAVSQSVMRSTLSGWLHNLRPAEVFTQVSRAISAIGINRANAMAALMTVKAFTTGTLDTFSAAGVKQVGLIPEQLKAPKTTRDAYSKSFGFSGPGSRSTREELPSASTIFRITKNEQNIEADLEAEGDFIEVQTAGDDNVCQQCQDIEGDNPYTIDEARSLIPAHPNCRCAFVPVDDGSGGGFLGMVTSFFGNFFNAKTVADMNENHDPKTGQFSEGSSSGGDLNKGSARSEISPYPHEPHHGGRIGTSAEMNKVLDDVTKQLGYNRDYIKIGKTEKFVLNGKERSSAASTSLWTLHTVVSDVCPMEQLPGTIAHEAMHAKFENYMRGYHSGKLPPDMMAFHKSINFDELKKLDGISAYSHDYWTSLAKGGKGSSGIGSSLKTAVHETLAEMARVHLDYGKPDLPGGVNSDWKKLYDNVNTFFSTRTNPKGLHV